MSKTINIFLGSIGNSINNHKEKVSKINNQYLTNLRIIKTRQYLCNELINYRLYNNVNYVNNMNMFIALLDQEAFNTLDNIYGEVQNEININDDNFTQEIINRFHDEYLTLPENIEKYEDLDIESVYQLIILYIKLKRINTFDFDTVLNDEYNFIEILEDENESLKNQISIENQKLNNIIDVTDINTEESLTIRSLLSQFSALYKSVQNQLNIIYNKNLLSKKSNNVNIITIDDINNNISDQTIQEIIDESTNNIQEDNETNTTNTSEWRLIIEDSYLDKTSIHAYEQTTLHIGKTYLKNINDNKIVMLNSKFVKFNGFIIDNQYNNCYRVFINKIIAQNVSKNVSFDVICKYSYTYNGELIEGTELLSNKLNILK